MNRYSAVYTQSKPLVPPLTYLKSLRPMQHRLARSAAAAITQNGCEATIRPHLQNEEEERQNY